MADRINMPAGFGGLMRYGEEYESKFKLKPSQVIGFVILLVVFVTLLKILWPITG